MKATLSLTDGVTGTLESKKGGKLVLVVEAPDNDDYRRFLLSSLMYLETGRYDFDRKQSLKELWEDEFPPVTVDNNPRGSNYEIRSMDSDRYPWFETIGKSPDMLKAANRAVQCINRFNGLPGWLINELPHSRDLVQAYQMLADAVIEYMTGEIEKEDLQAALAECSGICPVPPKHYTPPQIISEEPGKDKPK